MGKTIKITNLSDTQADAAVYRLIIAQLEHDNWDNGLDMSAEAQGQLVKANNRLAKRIKGFLKQIEEGMDK